MAADVARAKKVRHVATYEAAMCRTRVRVCECACARVCTRVCICACVGRCIDVSFSCVVKTQRRWSNKIYKIELTKTRYNNQVLGKSRVDPQRAGLTLIAELTWSNLGLKGV